MTMFDDPSSGSMASAAGLAAAYESFRCWARSSAPPHGVRRGQIDRQKISRKFNNLEDVLEFDENED
ncbi:hypothetical protein [Paracoccus actinidiae]|uniref:hypothetical protein n=1 Tax=Paracoccus actinidiae TaxID=3064531 RepID=UPI0027D22C7A|nr:hypothetical protein [Paracoccus sp. M09]